MPISISMSLRLEDPGRSGGGGGVDNLLFMSGDQWLWIDGDNAIPVESGVGSVDLADLTEGTAPSLTGDALVAVDDPDGSPSDVLVPLYALFGEVAPQPGGRLSGTSGEPRKLSNQTAIETIYYTPDVGAGLPLYDTTALAWYYYLYSELSIAVPATTNTNYDVFAYLNSGAPALELLAWTDNWSRATDMEYLNGRYVKVGDNSRLLLGTIRTTGVSGQTEDSATRRFISNVYNKIPKHLTLYLSSSHAYSTGAWRAWNLTTERAEFVMPFPFAVKISGTNYFYSGGYAGAAINSTSGASVQTNNQTPSLEETTGEMTRQYGKGYYYLVPVEYGAGSAQFVSTRAQSLLDM